MNMTPCELTAMITALANTISADCTVETINLLAVIFTQLGDTLGTIATAQSLCGSESDRDS